MISAAIGKQERQRCAAPKVARSLREKTDIDPAAWRRFLERLRCYVAARVPFGSRDDVVGEIVLRLVKHQQKLAATRDPFAWITRVAANVVADHHRRRASKQRAMTAYASHTSLSADEGSPPINSASSDLAACVIPFIEQLSPPYRDALKLVEIERLSQKAAAAKLGLSVSGMKSRVQRGRSKLKEAILRCCAVQLDRRGEVRAYWPRTKPTKQQCCPSDACS